jgi:calcineurin-like phosphoesterase family protein
MSLFFTSDHHFGHKNIIRYAARPFRDVAEMNEHMVQAWNFMVQPDDVVYHLGDFAMGPIEEGLDFVRRLNGTKILVIGNHDRCFPHDRRHRASQIARAHAKYEAAGFAMLVESQTMELSSGAVVCLSHFPYTGDHFDGDRFEAARLPDAGLPLLHGHTHSKQRISRSAAGTTQIHVGVDAWQYAPVPETEVQRLLIKAEHVPDAVR